MQTLLITHYPSAGLSQRSANVNKAHSARNKHRSTQRWIESLNGEPAKSSIKDFPLPKGEGQGEGKQRTITKLRAGFRHASTASFRLSRNLNDVPGVPQAGQRFGVRRVRVGANAALGPKESLIRRSVFDVRCSMFDVR